MSSWWFSGTFWRWGIFSFSRRIHRDLAYLSTIIYPIKIHHLGNIPWIIWVLKFLSLSSFKRFTEKVGALRQWCFKQKYTPLKLTRQWTTTPFWRCTHPRSNVDTKHDGLECASPFKTWLFWVSTLDFRGVISTEKMGGIFHVTMSVYMAARHCQGVMFPTGHQRHRVIRNLIHLYLCSLEISQHCKCNFPSSRCSIASNSSAFKLSDCYEIYASPFQTKTKIFLLTIVYSIMWVNKYLSKI